MDQPDSLRLLFAAAQHGRAADVTALLADGADVNAKDANDGRTPLYVASGKGHAEVVTALLDANADANQVVSHGTTPLHIACQNGHG